MYNIKNIYNNIKFNYKDKDDYVEDDNSMINISLLINTTEIIINEKRVFNIPDILKFTKLIKLDVSKCSLTQLPILPKQLIEINCSYNKIINIKI